MLLSHSIDGYLLHRSTELSPETIKTEQVWLHQFLDHAGDVDVNDITASHVRKFLMHQRDRGLSPFSVRRCHTSISAFYTWLCDPEVELADHNPTDAVPPPKLPKRKPKCLSQDTIETLLECASKMRLKRRCRALVLFLVDTGCRVSEACGVTMKDIDLKTGRILVEGKGSKQRHVYLGSRAISAVWLYIQEERPEPAQVDQDNLFLTEDGYPMSRFCLREAITRLADKASEMTGEGIHATPHMFRHTAAVNHLKNGMDLVSLQHLLGHAEIATTRAYLDAIGDEHVGDVARRTSPSDNWKL
jgi:site-specific recombinase XerD